MEVLPSLLPILDEIVQLLESLCVSQHKQRTMRYFLGKMLYGEHQSVCLPLSHQKNDVVVESEGGQWNIFKSVNWTTNIGC